jgi:macrodomain Ter protein organizer (MatP/YcbG family)
MTVVTEALPAAFPVGGEPVINLRLSAAEGELVIRFTRLDIVGEVVHQLQAVLGSPSVLPGSIEKALAPSLQSRLLTTA